MNKFFKSIAIAATLAAAVTTTAHAQFSMPSIPGMGKSSGGAAADLTGQQDKLVTSFVAANKDVLNANSTMQAALGLQVESIASKATADSLTEGATKDNLDAANKQLSVSTAAVAAELAKGPKLDAKSKAAFGLGLASLASGVIKYVGVGKSVSNMASGLSSASPMQLFKLQPAVFMVAQVPGSLASLASTLKSAIDFAKSNDIPVASDATQALASL